MKEIIENLIEVEYNKRIFLTIAFGRAYDKYMENDLHFLRPAVINEYRKFEEERNRLMGLLNQFA